jgi:[acyl-carrier-protein] S-malonyltransferase
MKVAAEELAEALDGVRFHNALIPVIQNVNAVGETDSDTLKANLLKQLYSPVLWTDSVRTLVNNGVEVAVECGSGKVLAGLIKRIDRNLSVYGIEDPESLSAALKAFGQT